MTTYSRLTRDSPSDGQVVGIRSDRPRVDLVDAWTYWTSMFTMDVQLRLEHVRELDEELLAVAG